VKPGIRPTGRRRSRPPLVMGGALILVGALIAALDRRIAAQGMRWDATFIPAWWDVQAIGDPASDVAAMERLWLRGTRGRLSPAEAREAIPKLLARGLFGQTAWEPDLLEIAALRAEPIDQAQEIAERLSPWWGSVRGPTGSVEPGEELTFLRYRGVRPTRFASFVLVRHIRIGDIPLSVRDGVLLEEGVLVDNFSSIRCRVPEMAPGLYDVELLVDELLVPLAAGSVLRAAPPRTSLAALGVRALRHPVFHRVTIAVLPDGGRAGLEGPPLLFTPDWERPTKPMKPFGASLARGERPIVIAWWAAAWTLSLTVLWLLVRRVGRGRPRLLAPVCAGCKSALHAATSERCSECGVDLGSTESMTFIRFPLSATRLASATAITLIGGSALTRLSWEGGLASVRYREDPVRLIDSIESIVQATADVDPAAGVTREQAVELRRLLRRVLTRFEFRWITDADDDEPESSGERARFGRAVSMLLERLAARQAVSVDGPDRAIRRLVLDVAELADLMELPPRLIAAAYDRCTPPLRLDQQRYRAGTWTFLEPVRRSMRDRILPIAIRTDDLPSKPVEGDTSEPIRTAYLIPDEPGPFEIRVSYELSDLEPRVVPPLTATLTLEAVCEEEGLARVVTNPALRPFAGTPNLILHELGPNASHSSGWWAELQPRWRDVPTRARGSWVVETLRGPLPLTDGLPTAVDLSAFTDWRGWFKGDRFSLRMPSVILRFVPDLSLEGVDAEDRWGTSEAWVIRPELIPLGTGSETAESTSF
jgi:hypothetical protein